MNHYNAHQAAAAPLLAEARPAAGGALSAAFIWLFFGAGFIACTWLGVVPLELADALQAFVIVGAIAWLIAGSLLMAQGVKFLPKRIIRVYEGAICDGDTTIDLRQPFEAWVLKPPAPIAPVIITVVQQGHRLPLRIGGLEPGETSEHYPDPGTDTPGNDPDAIAVSARDTKSNASFAPAVLRQLDRYRGNNRATTATEPQATRPPLPFFGPLLAGLFAINTSAIAITLLACFSWMPRAASLCFGLTVLGAVFSLVWRKLGRTRFAAVALAGLFATVGVYYTSDAIVWRYGDAVTLDDLARGGAFRVERPYRLAEGSPRSAWGIGWYRDLDLPKVWWLGAAAIVADDADKADPIVLWAICEKQTSLTFTEQAWRKELTQNCGGQWKGSIMQPAPWLHREGYLRAVKGTELSFKLKATSNAHLVFPSTDASGVHRGDMMYSIIAVVGANGLWLAFFVALWAAYRIDARRTEEQA